MKEFSRSGQNVIESNENNSCNNEVEFHNVSSLFFNFLDSTDIFGEINCWKFCKFIVENFLLLIILKVLKFQIVGLLVFNNKIFLFELENELRRSS